LPLTVLASASTASQVEPGVLGFLIVAGLGVALFFLLRSMNKQLRKVSADRQYFSERPDLSERTGAGPAGPQEHRGGNGQES
jgi:hypothetical protein